MNLDYRLSNSIQPLNVELQISNSSPIFKAGMSNIEYKTQSNIQIFNLIYIEYQTEANIQF